MKRPLKSSDRSRPRNPASAGNVGRTVGPLHSNERKIEGKRAVARRGLVSAGIGFDEKEAKRLLDEAIEAGKKLEKNVRHALEEVAGEMDSVLDRVLGRTEGAGEGRRPGEDPEAAPVDPRRGVLKQYAAYDRWASDRVVRVMRALPEGHDLETRREVVLLMSHIASAFSIWLDRMAGLPTSQPVWKEEALDAVASALSLSAERLDQVVEGDDLSSQVEYRNSAGQAFRQPVAEIVMHLFNHATHHRGQIVRLLREAGIEPPVLDMIVFQRGEHPKASANEHREAAAETPCTLHERGGGWYEIRRGEEVLERVQGRAKAEGVLRRRRRQKR